MVPLQMALFVDLVNSRNKVIVAPSGKYGSIVGVITRKASIQSISDTDSRNLVTILEGSL